MHIVDRELVKQISWQGNPVEYDLSLFKSGEDLEEFIIPNPNVAIDLEQVIKKIPQTNRCVVWYYKDQWVAKKFNSKWKPEYGYYDIQLPESQFKFNFLWNRNPDLIEGIEYEFDPYRNYNLSLDESYYELVWYLDPRFVPEGDKIWAVKCKNSSGDCLGIKDMGYVTPKMEIEYNPNYENLNIDIDSLYPPYYYIDHVFFHTLNSCYVPEDEDVDQQWVVKMYASGVKLISTQFVDDVHPVPIIKKNTDLPDLNYEIDYVPKYWDLKYGHVWLLDKKHYETAERDTWTRTLDGVWAIKIYFSNDIEEDKVVGEVSPTYTVSLNPELPDLVYDIDYDVPYHDLGYELIWMLDEKHCENAPEPIWAVKIKYTERPRGTKIVGQVSPSFKFEYNPDLPDLTYNIDYVIPYHDLGYEHVWMLDKKHTVNLSEEIWAVKITPVETVEGTKIVGQISPDAVVEINEDIKGYNFQIPNLEVQYHDLKYCHTWMLDKNYSANFDIWAIKISYVKKTKRQKFLGEIAPIQKIEYNKAIKNLNIFIDYKISYHDRFYEHVWYLDERFSNGEKIWAARMSAAANTIGEKEIGTVVPQIAENLDVIFISYYQPNAEKNWHRVLEKAPWAKRVDGVKGIFNAHKKAAEIAKTDMFYVIDGDAYLVDDWDFNFQPSIFDRECCYVWSSKNPINDLTYQNGGVKLFSKKVLTSLDKWETLDMTTGIMPKLKSEERISCITKFNTDPFTTWRSAFRECVKLYVNNQFSKLNIWSTKGKGKKFGKYAIDAAVVAESFAQQNLNNQKELLKINDYNWLEKQFNKIYKK